MNILIDTHIFLWAVLRSERLTGKQKSVLLNRSNNIYVSSISIAEIMIKSSLGKLNVPFDPVKIIDEIGFGVLEFSAQDALHLKALPFYHKDPFDRMLISQALEGGFYMMTKDQFFAAYEKEGLRVLG